MQCLSEALGCCEISILNSKAVTLVKVCDADSPFPLLIHSGMSTLAKYRRVFLPRSTHLTGDEGKFSATECVSHSFIPHN